MSKKKKLLVFCILLTSVLILVCVATMNSGSDQQLQMASYAKEYFLDTYSLPVNVVNVEQERVGQNSYLPLVKVISADGTTYRLILNKRGYPLADDFDAVNTIAQLDLEQIKEAAKLCNIVLADTPTGIPFDHVLEMFRPTVFFGSHMLPANLSENRIYDLLERLRELEIDTFWIEIETPTFLMGDNMYGIQLAAESFSTDIDQSCFQEQFLEFAERIFWDESKFQKKLKELEQAGYRDASFCITGFTSTTVEITVSATPPDTTSGAETLDAFLEDMDESYFRLSGRIIVIKQKGAVCKNTFDLC